MLATGVDLTYSRAGVGITLMGLGLFLATLSSYRNDHSPSPWLVLSLVLGGGYFVARGMFSGPPAFQVSDGILIFCALSVFLAIQCLDLRSIKSVAISIVTLGGVNAIWGLVQFFNVSQGEGIKMTGMFGHYNLFAAFMNVSFFGALSFALESGRGVKFRSFFGVLSLLILVAIFYSGSRGGWVAFLAGGGVFGAAYLMYLKWQESKHFGSLLLAFVLAIVAGGITLSIKLEDISRTRGSSDTSGFLDGGRVVFQQWGVNFFLENPIIGNGPRSFEYMAEQNWKLDEIPYYAPDPDFVHNEFIQSLTDYGIIGFMIVMLVLFVCGVKGLISFLISSDEGGDGKRRLLIIFALAATVSLLMQSFFSFLMHTPTMVTLLALFIAILYGTDRKNSRSIFASGIMTGISGLAVIGGGLLSAASYFDHISDDHISHQLRAATLAFDSEMAERAGVEAHDLSLLALQNGDASGAQALREKAMEAFILAEKLNPHSLIALCSQARILDEMGRHEEAYPIHSKAVDRAKYREYFLRPLGYAARNRIILASAASKEGRADEVRELYKEAQKFLEIRKEMEGTRFPGHITAQLYSFLEAWLTYFEAQNLYREGDRLWKKRNAETGMALMLEAKKRYQASRKSVEAQEPLWAIQMNQLNENLSLLKGAGITPAEISPEEIERISKEFKSLETPVEKR